VSTDERARTPQDRGTTLPNPGETRFRVRLYDADGDAARHFTKGGPVEVWLEASEQPVDAGGSERLKYVLLPLAFPNYPIAREHAHRIDEILHALEAELEQALADAKKPIPTRDDGHRHVVRFARYSRAMPFSAECEVCMCELVDDVRTWARDRGLVDDTFLEERRPLVNTPTVKDAIEQAVNQDG
jgi:hypothetical protein